jgi:hypothetical protein
MQDPIASYWNIKLDTLKAALDENNFEAFIARDAAAARELVLGAIVPSLSPRTVSWGGSMTLGATGIAAALLGDASLAVLDPYEKGLAPADAYERRRQALLVDLYLTGSNAVTEDGRLVNLDMTGNRVGALTFGPRNVVVLVGRNKVVASLDDAMARVKRYASPANVMRLDKKNPCLKTAVCQDCKSSDRICNVWTITQKSFPRHRIKVVLVNEDLGL